MMLEIQELEKPFTKVAHGLVAGSIKLLESGITHPFTILNDRTRLLTGVLSNKMPWLVKAEKVLRSFRKTIYEIGGTEGLYLNMREAHDRTPLGYITEIRLIIPDSNRELEYRIYDAFRELLRTSSPLLFDLHIIKLRGRRSEEVIPKGFWRYE